MANMIPGWKDKALFTPGPLTTSRTVKGAMLQDLGSRDEAFISVVRDIRRRLLAIAETGPEYVAIPMQGSGTFGIEAVLATSVPRDGAVLTIINGAYGRRIAHMCDVMGIRHVDAEFPENTLPELNVIASILNRHDGITHVAIVHCETTTGIVNPIDRIGEMLRDRDVTYFVDAMSSFGAIPIDFEGWGIDYLVSSANKCIEGVPGFSFVIARRKKLLTTEGLARSLSLDLFSQWKGLETNGQFRFTPPTHALLAFHQALIELEAEGGVAGRSARYRHNYEVLLSGMAALGFETYLPQELQGYIITSFRYLEHDNFDFDAFYQRLNKKGYVIYPGKVSDAACFRVGNIGRLFESDMRDLLAAVRSTLLELNIELRRGNEEVSM